MSEERLRLSRGNHSGFDRYYDIYLGQHCIGFVARRVRGQGLWEGWPMGKSGQIILGSQRSGVVDLVIQRWNEAHS